MKNSGGYAQIFFGGLLGVGLVLLIAAFVVYGENTTNILLDLFKYSPRLLTGSEPGIEGGFVTNIAVSIVSMCMAVVAGTLLGIAMTSSNTGVRNTAIIIMNIFRNSPWLVLLYAMLYLLPFYVTIAGTTFTLSPFVKASIGLALPVMANMAEILRGSIETIHAGQWESARALGYRPLQVLRYVIIPQAIPRMIPNVMNLYAMLFIGSSLIVVTGTNDVLSVVRLITAADGDHFATALYLYVLFWFFLYCFPIATLSRWYENKIRESIA